MLRRSWSYSQDRHGQVLTLFAASALSRSAEEVVICLEFYLRMFRRLGLNVRYRLPDR